MNTNNNEKNCNTIEIPELLNQKQVAKILGVSTKLLERWRCYGGGPEFRKIGGSVRYELSDVLEFIKSHPKKGHTSQGGEK